jgi:phosphoribosyl 1,2-cyclic phosphodiesterase
MSLVLSPLFSGSSGNAIYLSDGTTSVLVDGGVSAKRIVHALEQLDVDPASISAILVTHEHKDHVYGIGPLARAFSLPVYATRGTWCGMESTVGALNREQRYAVIPNQPFKIGSLVLCAVPIPHDANEPVCYTFYNDGEKLALATDIGHIDPEMVQALSGAEFVFLEANHDLEMLENGPYPVYLKRRIAGAKGHLSNDAAAEIACTLAQSGTREFLLAHLSQENNTPDLALETVEKALREAGCSACVSVASRAEDGRIFRIG